MISEARLLVNVGWLQFAVIAFRAQRVLRVWEQYYGILYSPQLKGSEAKWSNPQMLNLPHQT